MSTNLRSDLIGLLRRAAPPVLRHQARRMLPMHRINQATWTAEDPFAGTEWEHGHDGGTAEPLGILFDFSRQHQHYIAACRELDVAYRVVDITADDWIERVHGSGCRLFLAWPAVYTTLWKQMFDERVRILVEDLGLAVYPSLKEIWLYESKRRTRDWLLAHRVPHPRTHVFFDERAALEFIRSAPLPQVLKTDLGASSRGVVICRSRAQAATLVRRAFSRGLLRELGDPRDRQWGSVIFQEYLADVKEWRLVRVGDSYFCRFKEKVGDFHSGSGSVRWEKPPRALLDSIRDLTERAGFTSMNLDFFETTDGRYLVNEMHTVFGAILETNLDKGGAHMGRWRPEGREWRFEPGYFYHNACANLRVAHVLEHLLPGLGTGDARTVATG